MRIAIHNHQESIHKLYDDTSKEVVVLDEDEATQIDVNADGHMVKDGKRWTLEVPKPVVTPESPVWQTVFIIENATEATALENSLSILNGRDQLTDLM
jgi:hypothetical protein